MATIEKGRKPMTLVNIFTVSPAQQIELADLLVRANGGDDAASGGRAGELRADGL